MTSANLDPVLGITIFTSLVLCVINCGCRYMKAVVQPLIEDNKCIVDGTLSKNLLQTLVYKDLAKIS